MYMLLAGGDGAIDGIIISLGRLIPRTFLVQMLYPLLSPRCLCYFMLRPGACKDLRMR